MSTHDMEYLSLHEASVLFHYPLFAMLAIVASIAPTTWLLPNFQGYLVSGAVLCIVIGYAVLFTDFRITVDPVFLVLFGGYWIGLVAHYLHSSNPNLLQYVLVTPIAVVATVVVLPRFVKSRPQTFTMALTLLSVLLMGIGVLILFLFHTTGVELYGWIGGDVMGLYAIRTPSVFTNPNTYGFFMMIGSFAALYTVLARGGFVCSRTVSPGIVHERGRRGDPRVWTRFDPCSFRSESVDVNRRYWVFDRHDLCNDPYWTLFRGDGDYSHVPRGSMGTFP